MRYISTKNTEKFYSDTNAILNNYAPDGGVFVPENFTRFTASTWERLAQADFPSRVATVLAEFLPSIPKAELDKLSKEAFPISNDKADFMSLEHLNAYLGEPYSLELWHGPSASYLDFEARLVPRLILNAHERSADRVLKKPLFLVAALPETAYAYVDSFEELGVDYIVFSSTERPYVQKRKKKKSRKKIRARKAMQDTRKNYNKQDLAGVVQVDTNIAKLNEDLMNLARDTELKERLDKENIVLQVLSPFSWSSILAKVSYFVSLYADLIAAEDENEFEKVNVVIPDNDLSNVLACLYAMSLGTNTNKIIYASNKNNELCGLIRNGKYKINRKTYRTNSPALDYVNKVNLQRLIFEFSERDSEKVNTYIESLKSHASFKLDRKTLRNMQMLLVAGFSNDNNTRDAIKDVYTQYDHIIDPHTAVGHAVYEYYLNAHKEDKDIKTIFLALYSPFTYPLAVAEVIFKDLDQFDSIDHLRTAISEEASLEIPSRYRLANAYKEVNDLNALIKGIDYDYYGLDEDAEDAKMDPELLELNLDKAQAKLKDLEANLAETKVQKLNLDNLNDLILEKVEAINED